MWLKKILKHIQSCDHTNRPVWTNSCFWFCSKELRNCEQFSQLPLFHICLLWITKKETECSRIPWSTRILCSCHWGIHGTRDSCVGQRSQEPDNVITFLVIAVNSFRYSAPDGVWKQDSQCGVGACVWCLPAGTSKGLYRQALHTSFPAGEFVLKNTVRCPRNVFNLPWCNYHYREYIAWPRTVGFGLFVSTSKQQVNSTFGKKSQ